MLTFKNITFTFFICLSTFLGFSQIPKDWTFQGIAYGSNYEQTSGSIYIQKKGEQVTVRREFINDDKDYSLFDATYQVNDKKITITETQLISKKLGVKNNLCKAIITLELDSKTGYWKGTITSRQCRNLNQSVIGYEAILPFNDQNENHYNNFWMTEFQKNLWKNYPSPQKIKELRDQFKLFPIYFDYDKFDIRSEYFAQLQEMIMIMDSHSDLRIRITGHTDWDGSNQYNDVLSKDRALAIKNYLMMKGIDSDKIVIEYKGKRVPIADNHTSEGKQLNRRVILEFITQ